MHDDNMNSHDKMKFPQLCRGYRTTARLKQREVANALNMKTSSYGNVESMNHKALSLDKVTRLARFFQLDETATAELVAAWEELPASEYSKRQAKSYEARKAFRSKARNHDRMRTALLEVTTLVVTTSVDPDSLCACPEPEPDLFADEGSPPESELCEICNALVLLGLPKYTNRDDVVTKLAAIQEDM